jgi:hypothetical protein
MRRQQGVYTPAMIRDPGSHSGRRGARSAETCMRGTKIIHGANQIHPVLHAHRAACQGSASTRQRCQALTKGRGEPLDVGGVTPSPCERRRRVSPRAGVPSTMRRSTSTPRRCA